MSGLMQTGQLLAPNTSPMRPSCARTTPNIASCHARVRLNHVPRLLQSGSGSRWQLVVATTTDLTTCVFSLCHLRSVGLMVSATEVMAASCIRSASRGRANQRARLNSASRTSLAAKCGRGSTDVASVSLARRPRMPSGATCVVTTRTPLQLSALWTRQLATQTLTTTAMRRRSAEKSLAFTLYITRPLRRAALERSEVVFQSE